MAKGVGGGIKTKTKTKTAATPKKRSTVAATKPVKKLSKATTAAKPVKKLSEEERIRAVRMAHIAELIERQKNGEKLSKAAEWTIAHPNGLEGTIDMRAVMR